ncbi:hypothetical protein [Actinoplanes aureus]|uniref:Uncharacterized protein n=1 Tax=Actinoplanes aureus TaxID=2792083 RepID=A0A931FXC8_9ACTN|nr:hypothetical protein [Actinoplanes aureus]MBG0560716.1 hypothetical protein [Actinoplanes aureus]
MISLVQLAADQGATNADWIEAWATVAAAIGTIGAFIWQGRALRNERETRRQEVQRLEHEQLTSLESQARTIVVHEVDIQVDKTKSSSPLADPKYLVTNFVCSVENFGTLPILAVSARLLRESTVPDDGFDAPVTKRFPVIKGGDKERLNWLHIGLSLTRFTPGAQSKLEAKCQVKLEVRFVDVHGHHWLAEVRTAPAGTDAEGETWFQLSAC